MLNVEEALEVLNSTKGSEIISYLAVIWIVMATPHNHQKQQKANKNTQQKC